MINLDRYRKVDELFQAALDLDPADRAEFVRSACSGDASLRQEVEALLASVGEESDIGDVPIPELARLFLPDKRPELNVGERLGHYKILSLLGTGGMGQVYLAEDSRLGRKVALKLLPGEFTKDEFRLHRLQHEARAASSLNHPNILTIYEIAEVDGRSLIATEFIDGETLRQRVQRSKLTTEEILDIAVHVAGAIAAAHHGGIIHRDIKPENIMLRRDGLVKVLDFGLAKLEEQRLVDEAAEIPTIKAETGESLRMGTVPYMSPEQIRGEPVDSRSDIFSFGVVLYELIAGHKPFEGESTAELIASIMKVDPAPFDRLDAFSSELQQIVDKALAKQKQNRYQTAEQLFEDLSRLKNASVVQSRIARDRGYRLWAIAAAALLALAGLTYFLMRKPSGQPNNMRIAAVPGGERSVGSAVSHNGRYIVYVVQDAGKQSMWIRDLAANMNTQIAPAAAVEYSGPAFSRDDESIYYVKTDAKPAVLYRIPTAGGEPEKVLADVGSSVTFSPDGQRFAFIRNVGKGRTALIQSNAEGSGERVIAERQMPESFSGSLDWSPDGKLIACSARVAAGERYVRLIGIEADSGAEKDIPSPRWRDIANLKWLADGGGLMLSAVQRDYTDPLQLWQLSYPQGELRRITNDLNQYQDISMTADSKMLVTVKFEWRTNLWVAPSGDSARALPITQGKRDLYQFVSWTPGFRLVFPSDAGGHRDIWMMEADGTDLKQLTADAGNNLQSSVSPDGRYILFSSNRDEANFNVWRIQADGTNPAQLTHGSGEAQPRCSPDGAWVIYTSGAPEGSMAERTIWKVPIDGGEPIRLTDKPSNWPDVSPDGKLIACWYKTETELPWQVAIFGFEGGRPERLFSVPGDPERAIRWTPDGKAVTFIVTRNGISNIWSQELAGSDPKQITHFTSEAMRCFDWARDGRLVCSRVSIARDLVLIRNFR